MKNRSRTRPTWFSTWPFSQPEAGVQGRSLWRHWFKPNGRRLDQIMAAHLQEAAIVESLLAGEDRLRRRLHVVIDPARAGATEKGEAAIMRVKDHLLALARIGSDEHHPAVAEPDMAIFTVTVTPETSTTSWLQSN